MNDYTIKDSISGAGVYMLPAGAYSKVELNYSDADESVVIVKELF